MPTDPTIADLVRHPDMDDVMWRVIMETDDRSPWDTFKSVLRWCDEHGTDPDGMKAEVERIAAEHISPQQADDMRHAVRDGHWNHFLAQTGSASSGSWSRLVLIGLAERGLDIGSAHVYHVTPLGRAVLHALGEAE